MDSLPADLFRPDEEQAVDIRRLAALGYTPRQMAAALGLDTGDALLFLRDAATPATAVAALMRQAVIETAAAPQVKLHEAAEAGNVEAVRELQKIQRRNEFNRLIEQIDDDELTLYD